MTPWTAACQASLSISNFQSLLKLISIKSVMPSSHLKMNWGRTIQSIAITVTIFKKVLSVKFQFSSITQPCSAPWSATHQASLSFTNTWSLLKLMSIELVMPSNYLILCHPLLLPSIFPSIRVFFSESVLHIRWPKCWSFSFSISPSNEYSGLISFRIDWFDLQIRQWHPTPVLLPGKSNGRRSLVGCNPWGR